MPIYRWDGTVWNDVITAVVPWVPPGGPPDPGAYAAALAARQALVYGQGQNLPVANTSAGILSTSNCGLLDPSVLTAYNAPSVVDFVPTDGQQFQDKIIYGDIRPPAAHLQDIVFRNCRIRGGPNNPDYAAALVRADNARSGTGKIIFIDCEFDPQRPAIRRDGVRGNRVDLYRCYIHDTTDLLSLFAFPTHNGGSASDNVMGCLLERMRYWNPDYLNGVSGTPEHNNPSDGTHNDCIALNGGRNINIKGNLIKGTALDGATTTQLTNSSHPQMQASGYSMGGCILFTNTTGVALDTSVVVEDNWFYGALSHFNIKANMVATVRNNRHYRAVFVGSTSSGYWIRYDQRAGNGIVCASDVWMDGPYAGQILVEPRDKGINFNT